MAVGKNSITTSFVDEKAELIVHCIVLSTFFERLKQNVH